MIGAWSAEEDALLRKRKEEGLGNEAISAETGRTVAAVKSRWAVLTEGSAAKEARREAWIVRNRARHAAKGVEQRTTRRDVPVEIWAERNARFAAPMTITGFVFGDPPRGHSMLDKVQSSEAWESAR